MGIFLGATELGGSGGGGTPIGGYAFFETPPNYNGFVSGQEVWTDASSQVWLKTEAVLTSAGAGALDASIYTDSVKTFSATSSSFSSNMGGANRLAAGWNGKNIFATGYGNGGNGGMNVSYIIRDAEGVNVSSANNVSGIPWSNPASYNYGTQLWHGSGSFGNDTHAFTTFCKVRYDGSQSNAGPQWGYSIQYAYKPYTAFTGGTAGYATSDQSTYWTKGQFQQIVVTNTQTTPRYWSMNYNGTTATEMTFNSSTANGGNPFTATSPSNTINFGITIGQFRSNGVDKFYGHTGTTLSEFNFDGSLVRNYTGVPGATVPAQYNYANYGVIIIPPFETTSGNTEFWFPVVTVSTGNPNTNFTKYEPIDIIKGPVYTSGTAAVSLAGVGDIAIVDNTATIFMWKRIA